METLTQQLQVTQPIVPDVYIKRSVLFGSPETT